MSIFDHFIFYRIGKFLAEHLPINLSYFIATLISDIHYIFAYRDRYEVTQNLKVIFPNKNKKEISKIRLNLFRNFAKYLVDFFHFSKLDMHYIKRKIKIENIDHLNEAVSKKKGIIGLTAHLGNWELGGIVMAMLGYDIWAVALPHQDRRVDSFFNIQREKKGLKVIPISNAKDTCLSLLKNSKIVALLGDRDFTESGILIEFFKKPSLFPIGPAVFSIRTDSPIIAAFMIREKKDFFILRFEKPIYPPKEGTLKEKIKKIITQYKVIFEDYIQKYPEQWYMFRRFWNESMCNNTYL
ncbi:MAG: lysophospholipid acyltransferase family protein [Candidatus Omnitrophica bacterium]|nr:lysophospholipid acyltransferase family protein [Candidatus Omnitrophota bacterium]